MIHTTLLYYYNLNNINITICIERVNNEIHPNCEVYCKKRSTYSLIKNKCK